MSLNQLDASQAVYPVCITGVYADSEKLVPSMVRLTDPVSGLLVLISCLAEPASKVKTSEEVERNSPCVISNRSVDLMPPGVKQVKELSLIHDVLSALVTPNLVEIDRSARDDIPEPVSVNIFLIVGWLFAVHTELICDRSNVNTCERVP